MVINVNVNFKLTSYFLVINRNLSHSNTSLHIHSRLKAVNH